MVINHNISALNTFNKLNNNTKAAQNSLEKLSSGLRINKAGDDAAGLAISQKMQAQINGLDQASSNAQNGISLIQTAEGALNETQSILQRMNTLATQSANDTNTSTDRSAIQAEVNQLTNEIDRIANTTQFNTKNLLDGTMGKTFVTSANALAPTDVQIIGSDITTGNYTLTATAAGTDAVTLGANTAASTLATTDITAATGTKYGDYSLAVTRGSGSTANLTLTGPDGKQTTVSGANLGAAVTINGVSFAFNTHALDLTANSSGNINFSLSNTGLTIGLSGDKTASSGALTNYKGETLDVGGFSFSQTWGSAALNDTSVMTVTDKSIKFQIGSNADQNISLSINKMDSAALKVNAIDISTQTSANNAITTIQNAINTVSTQRASLGAYQNRLEHTINNLSTESQNLSSASSQITDVDMAKEMTEFTKNNILTQAAQAMLAQANQLPQGVLSLLK